MRGPESNKVQGASVSPCSKRVVARSRCKSRTHLADKGCNDVADREVHRLRRIDVGLSERQLPALDELENHLERPRGDEGAEYEEGRPDLKIDERRHVRREELRESRGDGDAQPEARSSP